MRHLFNKRSGRNLCEVRSPKLTENVSDRGQILGGTETTCSKCSIWYDTYAEQVRSQFEQWANTRPKRKLAHNKSGTLTGEKENTK
jgi:hypothetical protein